MNEKTMRKWFKTFLMLLPFLFLAIFAIGVRKDGLKYEIPNSGEGFDIIEEKPQADENAFINIPENLNEDGYLYLYYDASNLMNYYNFSPYVNLGSFTDVYNTEMRLDLDTNTLEFHDLNNGWSTQIPQSLEEYADEIYVDEILYADIESFINWGTWNVGQLNQVSITIYFNYNPTSYVEGELKLYVEDADVAPKVLVDRPKNPEYIEGPQAVLLHFNDMIEENFNFNAFGMNDFYDWMNENWFNSEAPLIIKPVFTLLVYEAIIELIFLMFSFITFLIRFAQQWIDGFYTKGGSK